MMYFIIFISQDDRAPKNGLWKKEEWREMKKLTQIPFGYNSIKKLTIKKGDFIGKN